MCVGMCTYTGVSGRARTLQVCAPVSVCVHMCVPASVSVRVHVYPRRGLCVHTCTSILPIPLVRLVSVKREMLVKPGAT
jgi:hypothetical protein